MKMRNTIIAKTRRILPHPSMLETKKGFPTQMNTYTSSKGIVQNKATMNNTKENLTKQGNQTNMERKNNMLNELKKGIRICNN